LYINVVRQIKIDLYQILLNFIFDFLLKNHIIKLQLIIQKIEKYMF